VSLLAPEFCGKNMKKYFNLYHVIILSLILISCTTPKINTKSKFDNGCSLVTVVTIDGKHNNKQMKSNELFCFDDVDDEMNAYG
jgi:hypothetical protein